MNTIIKYGCLIGFACAMATPIFAGDQKIILMLGGRFCDAYFGDVTAVLMELPGVTAVDLKSMKGHAVITIDGKKVKGDQLAAAVNGVKGDGWYCTGQAMK